MNYTILNDNDFYRNINLNNFKEVSVDGRERVDGVFGTITEKILEESSKYDGEGDIFFGTDWFYGDSGTIFMVLRAPQNILYDETGESIEKCLGFFNPEDVYVEMGAIKLEDKKNTYEYFLIAYKKSLGFQLILDEKFIEKKEEEIIPYICEKLEKIL